MYVKWKLLSVRFEIVLVLAQDRCMVAPNVPRARKSFWAHPILLLGDIGQEEACFGLFADSVNLGQHWYTKCVECTMGKEIILGSAYGTPMCRESCGSSFRFIWR